MTSYKVLSQHYEESSSAKSSPKVDAKDIKSNLGMAIDRESTAGGQPTRGSYGHAAEIVIPTKYGVVSRSSGAKFETSWRDYRRNGPLFNNDDRGHGGWIKNGTGNYSSRESNKEISSVPMPKIAYIEGIKQLRTPFPNPYDTPVAKYTTPTIANIGPINDTGKNVSRVENRRGDVRNFQFDDRGIREETLAWEPVLSSMGLSPKRDNPVYAIGVEHDVGGLGHIAAYYHEPEKRYLVFEANFDNAVKAEAAALGIPGQKGVDALKRSDISHEAIRHGRYEIGGSQADEHLQGLIGFRFHSDQAKKYEGTEEGRINETIAERERQYAKAYSRWQSIKDTITQSLHSAHGPKWHIANMAWQHGKALGKKGEELKEYIKERVEELYGSLEGEPSYKGNKRTQGLEGIVENENRVSFVMRDGKLVPTIDGMVAGEDGAKMSTEFVGRYLNEDSSLTYKANGNRSMDDVKANLKKGENAKHPEKPNAEAHEAEAMAEAA